jgi:hypothetical protein
MDGALVGAVIGLVFAGVMLAIAFVRRGSVAAQRIGGRRLEVQAAAPPDAVFERLRAMPAPYRVEDADAAQRKLVLSTNPSFASFGFFYPIEIHARPDGGSAIHVGILSKVFQYGPIVTRWHRKAIKAIEEQVTVPGARVVA